ncbi:Tyrosinase [Arthrobotrys entomopaga]|nr:Tyrosinase [Arthrobotrys entomopaga]
MAGSSLIKAVAIALSLSAAIEPVLAVPAPGFFDFGPGFFDFGALAHRRHTTHTTTKRTTTTTRTTTKPAKAKRTTTTTKRTTTTSSKTTKTSSKTTTTSSKTTTTSSKTTTTAASTATSFAIVGASGGCVNRMRIDNMQSQQPDTYNLLLLALRQLQTTSSTNSWSWYGIGGIHGAPFVPWPNPNAAGSYNRGVGYCPHGSVLFGSWHRPYMIALEQQLVAAGNSIANTFTGSDKTRYVAAAALLRFPYWDWAAADTQSHLPSQAKAATVQVNTPTGTQTIANPLLSYVFQSGETSSLFGDYNGFYSPYNTIPKTIRDASGNNNVFTDNENGADTNMQNGFQNRRSQLYSTLMMTGSYNDFSSSLEGIHNDVHNEIGGNWGHMTWLTYSAFDPIFWLHHNNVDRLFAIWQAANPGVVMQTSSGVSTFARPNAPSDTITTPLYPFTHANGASWTSQDVASASSVWQYGYGFPEVPCSSASASPSQLDSFTTSQINSLYSSRVPSKKSKRSGGQTVVEWNINVLVDQSEHAGGFSINFFLGQVPTDPTQWPSLKIGTLTVLGGFGMTMVSNIVTATIPLNQVLGDKLNESADDIQSYLAANLVWGAISHGVIIDIATLTSLQVGVTNNEVTLPPSITQKPSYGTPKLYTKVTKGKHGGVTNSNQLQNPRKKNGGAGYVPGRFKKIHS